MPANPVVLIPARMASTRLPDKPMADINGEPMIVHVWRRAVEADIGPVVVAAGEAEIVDAIKAHGGKAVLTRPDHPSGSDRIHECLTTLDPDRKYDAVVNLQGDLPTLAPDLPGRALGLLDIGEVDIGTLAAEIGEAAENDNPNVVKVVPIQATVQKDRCEAKGFTRKPMAVGAGPIWHHIGLYAWRRDALERFVALPPSPLELRDKLEQMRALENGMRIDVAFVDTVPLGVDTSADLDRARRMLE
jgi:3-deoxy-manno-octulosonate cytidylyltransferase (CMP-KDO synthetase)